jgi:rSAM/selenodomain-associated transferase 1
MPLLLAKPAQPGTVKTRLLGTLTPHQAAEVHAAMLECVLIRTAAHFGPGQLALADPNPDAERAVVDAQALAESHGWTVTDQGRGDLGQRLKHVWRRSNSEAVLFLGVDSPDVPAEALAAIPPALSQAQAAIGPAADGGYWTLAARGFHPELISDIAWGTDRVYEQTRIAAERAKMSLKPVPGWYDVDDMEDLQALGNRLRSATEPALTHLRQRLKSCCGSAL